MCLFCICVVSIPTNTNTTFPKLSKIRRVRKFGLEKLSYIFVFAWTSFELIRKTYRPNLARPNQASKKRQCRNGIKQTIFHGNFPCKAMILRSLVISLGALFVSPRIPIYQSYLQMCNWIVLFSKITSVLMLLKAMDKPISRTNIIPSFYGEVLITFCDPAGFNFHYNVYFVGMIYLHKIPKLSSKFVNIFGHSRVNSILIEKMQMIIYEFGKICG